MNVPSPAAAPPGVDGSAGQASLRVLLVDDEPALRDVCAWALAEAGFAVDVASDGGQAIGRIRSGSYDVIVSDISMPRMGGLELLRRVRDHDLDVPVILMTGAPALATAIKAVEYGAFRYLVKPVALRELAAVASRAARLHGLARLKRQAQALAGGEEARLGDRASLEARFSRALGSLWTAYQPIVSWRARAVFAFEALVRSAEPGLTSPGDLLPVAERLGRLHGLGRAVRAGVAAGMARVPGAVPVFLNLHSLDLEDGDLYAAGSALGPLASRVVLEITERASLDGIRDLASRVAALRRLGFQLAVDDLGAGYAGLATFAQLEPEVVKLDMSLVRGIDAQPTKERVVRSMIELCGDLGMRVICEGVETPAERDTLAAIGGDLLQGFLFARPQRDFPAARW